MNEMMRAAVITAYGPAENLQIAEVLKPEPGPKDVLVRVVASSVNPVDVKQRAGSQRVVVPKVMPAILGMDVSGVVEAVGAEVTKFTPGDLVWSSPSHKRPGTWAEYVVIDESEVGLKPESLDHEQAASLPLVALTAWECLVEGPGVKEGDKVLIQAGSGGVGTAAIQIAKYLNAEVATTCSGRNEELVRSLGADTVVDYTKQNYWEVLPPQDHVLESIGPSMWSHTMAVLRRGGHMASITTGLPGYVKRWGPYLGVARTGWAMFSSTVVGRLRGLTVRHVLRDASGDKLDRLAAMVAEGALKPVVEEVIPLANIAEANRRVESGRTRGKIVVRVSQ